MGLKRSSSPQVRRIRTSMVVLALIAQSLYGFGQSSVVHAITNSTVSPDSMSGWQVVNTNDNGGSVNFINTFGSSGTGSVRFDLIEANRSRSLRTSMYSAVKLSDITTLSYKSNVQAGRVAAPALQLDIDTDVSDADTNADAQLIYSPYKNGDVSAGEWQYQDARAGLWWSPDATDFGFVCSQLSPCTMDTVITLYPAVGLAGGESLGLTVSTDSDEVLISYADSFIFNDDTHNFEAVAAPQLTSPAHEGRVGSTTFTAAWHAVPFAGSYVYESYNDEAAMQPRVSEMVSDTQKSETDLTNGTALWWRVKTVDQQGNEGAWSELRSASIEIEGEGTLVGSIVSGSDSEQTQELLAQLARLNEPFVVPEPIDVSMAPSILGAIEAAGDNTDIQMSMRTMSGSPVADHGAETVAVVPTQNGWKFFGVLWYWWVLPAVILIALAIRTASQRRPTRLFLYSSDQI